MKRLFFTGLVILLPLVVTILLLVLLVNILTRPFLGLFEAALSHWGALDPLLIPLVAEGCVLIFLVAFTILLGFLTRWVVIHTLISYGDRLLHKIPFVNRIYHASKDLIDMIAKPSAAAPRQVVLVPWPHPEAWSLALLTHTNVNPEGDSSVSVFIPGSPSLMQGFVMAYRQSQLIYLDMTVEEAMKMVVSCGVVFTDLKIHHRATEITEKNEIGRGVSRHDL